MSEHNSSWFHLVWGIGGGLVSLIGVYVGYINKLDDNRTSSGSLPPKRTSPPSGPVIVPSRFETLWNYAWTDSLPFSMDVLADAGISNVGIERFVLPESLATERKNLELGPESGERSFMADYFIDPKERFLKKVISKDMGISFNGGPAAYSTFSTSFEKSWHPGYPGITALVSINGGNAVNHGKWLFDEKELPVKLEFDASSSTFVYREPSLEAVLKMRVLWYLHVYFAKPTISQSNMSSTANRIKYQMLKDASMDQSTPVTIFCHRGERERADLEMEITSKGILLGVWTKTYDSLGHPVKLVYHDPNSDLRERKIDFHYTAEGYLAAWEEHRTTWTVHRELRYSDAGWPEKLLEWEEFPNGKMKIVARTFFEFNRL